MIWAKVAAVLAALDEAEWVVWMDNDSLIVNHTLSLNGLLASAPQNRALYIVRKKRRAFALVSICSLQTRDFNGVNFGMFVVRSCPFSRFLFASLLRVKAANSTLHRFQEQKALNVVLESMTVCVFFFALFS